MARNEHREEDFAYEDLDAERNKGTGGTEVGPLLGSGAFTSGLLLLTGFGFVAFGVALQLAPRLAWPLVEVERTLTAQGAPPFVVALTGFVAFGFGLVHRAARRPHMRVAPSEDRGAGERGEQLQMELVGGLHRVQETVEGLGRRLVTLDERQQALQQGMQQHASERQESGASNEAVFRLAAGLDKLHARLDTQLGALSDKTTADVARLNEALQGLGDQLQGLGLGVQALERGVQALDRGVQALDERGRSAASMEEATPPAPAPPPVARTTHAPPAFEVTMDPQLASVTPAPAVAAPMPELDAAPARSAEEPRDFYAETAAAVHGPAPTEAELPIDSERMVEEGLDALSQLEDGRTAFDEDPPAPAMHAPAPEHQEFHAVVSELDRAVEPPRPAAESAPLGLETPPPALPAPPATPASEDALEALLPDSTLREALDGRS